MSDIDRLKEELEEIKKELAAQIEGSRAYKALEREKAEVEVQLLNSGVSVQENETETVEQDGIGIDGDMKDSNLIKGDGNKIFLTTQNYYGIPSTKKSLSLPEALQHYLDNIVITHQHLRLQGIRAGSQLLSVSLEKVYVSLTAMDKRAGGTREEIHSDSGTLTIGAVLQSYRRLVIIGDPGSGKTTLLSYLTFGAS